MFIDEKEADQKLSSLDNLLNRLNGSSKVDYRKVGGDKGREKGRIEDSLEKKAEIATDAIVMGPSAAAAKHDTTISRASLLSRGIVTHRNSSDEELAPLVQSKKDQVHEKALDIITKTLLSLDSKIDSVQKPVDLSAIAANMAKIAEKTGGKGYRQEEESRPKVQVVIFTPRSKEAEEFETIDI